MQKLPVQEKQSFRGRYDIQPQVWERTEFKSVRTLIETAYLKFQGEEDRLPNNRQYKQAVGVLLYIATTN